jgi:hypothetical protein
MSRTGDIGAGDIVTVLAVPAALVSGLPDDERTFLLSLVGGDVTVSDTSPDWIEIEAFDAASGIVHFLRMAARDIDAGAMSTQGRSVSA